MQPFPSRSLSFLMRQRGEQADTLDRITDQSGREEAQALGPSQCVVCSDGLQITN